MVVNTSEILMEALSKKTASTKDFANRKLNAFNQRCKAGARSLWFLNYDWRRCLADDLVAGLTIAIMQVPQGMAYAMLANVSPEMGIYCSIFPVLVYGFLGPSAHISIGTCGPLCLLVASIIGKHMSHVGHSAEPVNITEDVLTLPNPVVDLVDFPDGGSSVVHNYGDDEALVGLVGTLCLLTGMWQLVLAAVQFGNFSWVLSDVVMSAYTTGASIHVLSSQLKSLFGLALPSRKSGILKLIYTNIDFIHHASETNPATLLVGLTTILTLLLHEFIIKPKMSKMCRFPLPIQLLVVIFGTGMSYIFSFETLYQVDVVGDIPTGFPTPTVPSTVHMPELLVDSLILAIVGYSISLSLAQLFAHKFHYTLDGNHELFVEGMSNIVGSFFSCIPAAASMARCMVLLSVGGKSQLSGLFSALILILVILFIGPLFHALPKSVLSAIIVVALKGMFVQTRDFRLFFAKSKLDGLLWLGTFLGVVLTNVDVGLLIAVGLTILVMACRSYSMTVVVKKDHPPLLLAENTVVLNITGVLTFANMETVLKKCRRVIENKKADDDDDMELKAILEMSCVPYVDQMAAKTLLDWIDDIVTDDLANVSVVVPQDEVKQMLESVGIHENVIYSSLAQITKSYGSRVKSIPNEDMFVTIL